MEGREAGRSIFAGNGGDGYIFNWSSEEHPERNILADIRGKLDTRAG